MDLSKMKVGIIGCIRIAEHPTAPVDQENPIPGECPGCLNSIWISDKKRALQKAYPDLLTLCMECAVEAMKQLEAEGVAGTYNIVDISKTP